MINNNNLKVVVTYGPNSTLHMVAFYVLIADSTKLQ